MNGDSGSALVIVFTGDVRGQGMFLGLDLVKNRETREPATAEAAYINKRSVAALLPCVMAHNSK